jgi:hypothetical protein
MKMKTTKTILAAIGSRFGIGITPILISAFQLFSFSAFSQTRSAIMVSNATGVLAAPTNFFAANSNLLNQAVGGGGGGTTVNTNILMQSNAVMQQLFTNNGILLTNLSGGNVTGNVPVATVAQGPLEPQPVLTTGPLEFGLYQPGGTMWTLPTGTRPTVDAASGNIQAASFNGAPQLSVPSVFDYFYGRGGNTTATGANNVGVGYLSLGSIAAGNNNLAFGTYTLANEQSGSYNVAIGYGAVSTLNGVSEGDVGIGNDTLGRVATGTGDIAIGNLAGFNYTGAESGNICIGHEGVTGENGIIHIGTDGTQTSALLAGIVQPTSSGGYKSANGALGGTANVMMQTNATGPHGYTLCFTNGLFIQAIQY